MKFLDKFIYRSPLLCFTNDTEDVLFNEALYLSSPVLYNEKNRQERKNKLKDVKKLKLSIYKYHSRSTTRCTPFGLFAGVGVGNWNANSDITLSSDYRKSLKRKTHLDMNVLCLLAQKLSKHNSVTPFLHFFPNNSIYRMGDSYRYVEYYYVNTQRIHKITQVDYSTYLETILLAAKDGKTHTQLNKLLISDDITIEEANDFISELIDAQILISELEPNITGVDYFDNMLNLIEKIFSISNSEELKTIIKQLITIKQKIQLLDENVINIFGDNSLYNQIFESIKNILPFLKETDLFKTDLFKNAETANLNICIQEQIKEVITFFNKITPQYDNDQLEEFKKQFIERYEDNEVPLLHVLDAETGVGYPSKDSNGLNPLLEDVFLSPRSNMDEIKWNKLQATLHQLIIESIQNQAYSIQINEKDFKDIDFTSQSLPHSLSVMFRVLCSKTNKIFLDEIGGSSAINIIGRFASDNSEVKNLAETISLHEKEQFHNIIYAEVVHLPESRTGNILTHPTFKEYEIPYLSKSSVSIDFQIELSDLSISVKNNVIILRSKKLNKEIIPRISNAHNYKFNSLPVYHFLGDLQLQYFNKPYLGFNWGVLENEFKFLPRVEFKNIILKPASWQLNKTDFSTLLNKKLSDEELLNVFHTLKVKIGLPEMFLIVDGDHQLFINTKKEVAILTFIDYINKKSTIKIEEFLYNSENPLVKDTNGNGFTNECIAIVLNEGNKIKGLTIEPSRQLKSVQNFTLGSEWLYYKFYCGIKTADKILTELVKPLTEELLTENLIDKFFFIRYADSDLHIRLRFHVYDLKNIEKIIFKINEYVQPYLVQGLVSKIQTDTYKRELLRYGDCSIDLAETFFYIDSISTIHLLNLIDGDEGEQIRWQFALRSIDELLNNFKFTFDEKLILLESLKNIFINEHGGSKELKIQLDTKFRNVRKKVENILNREIDSDREILPIIEILKWKNTQISTLAENIIKLKDSGQLEIKLSDLLGSYIHMMLNRIFQTRQRTNEMVVYDLLYRYYKSYAAKEKRIKG